MQTETANLIMWEKHRKISFTGSKNCGKFTVSHRSNLPSAPAFPTSIIRPLRRALKKNYGFPHLNGWPTPTALKFGNCSRRQSRRQKLDRSQNAPVESARPQNNGALIARHLANRSIVNSDFQKCLCRETGIVPLRFLTSGFPLVIHKI